MYPLCIACTAGQLLDSYGLIIIIIHVLCRPTTHLDAAEVIKFFDLLRGSSLSPNLLVPFSLYVLTAGMFALIRSTIVMYALGSNLINVCRGIDIHGDSSCGTFMK
jgi:hypothetical protein